MEGFSIKIDYYAENNEIVIIKLLGYIDQSNSFQIEKVISDLIHSRKNKFVFDLSELIYMSSAGWGIFVAEVKSVRDAGGDIKVASMSPELYDVFQVLEFYHILEDYSSVHDAATSFMENGKDRTGKLAISTATSRKKGRPKINKTAVDESETTDEKVEIGENEAAPVLADTSFRPFVSTGPQSPRPVVQKIQSESAIDISRLPLTEKIKKIIAVYPLLNIIKIRKMLNHEKFGSVKISHFKLYRMLRLLNLHTKKNRYRYYRSV
jgi:anti-sigma B factor antagonist